MYSIICTTFHSQVRHNGMQNGFDRVDFKISRNNWNKMITNHLLCGIK